MDGTQYCYDGRGNRVRSIASNGVVQQVVKYTAYGQAREVVSTVTGTQGHVTRYFYGPERQRIRRMDFYNASATGSADVADEIGNAEIITRLGSSTRELRRSLGPVILSRMINSSGVVIGSNDRYLFADAQGSVHRITAADGTVIANEGSRWFTAFGARAETTDGDEWALIDVLRTATDQITRLSYTGHQAADHVGLVHMNGRMYDPITGRFLQADPLVQDPSNPQNFNRYTYVFNNPLAWTDPTGYWGAREQGALRTVVAIVIAVYTGVYINPGTAALTASQTALVVASGAAVGALQTGTLRGALVGAFTAGVGVDIGNAFARGTFGYVAAHAALGGVTSVLNGGKFGHGFVSAGFSTALSPQINTGNDFGDGFLHAMVGGTASRLSGGKFANGAVTGAFSFAVGRVAQTIGGAKGGGTSGGGSLPRGASRGLTAGEFESAGSMFGEGMDWGRVRIWNKKYPLHFGFQKNDMAISPNGGDIYFGPAAYMDDFSSSTGSMSFLVHELAHVWQVQNGFGLTFPPRGYNYAPVLARGGGWAQMTTEGQAEVVTDLYLRMNGYRPNYALPIGHSAATLRSLVPFSVPGYQTPSPSWGWQP